MCQHVLERLKSCLKGKIVIVGIGNSLRSDDAAGSILATRLKDRVPFRVFNAGSTPENYLEKIIEEKPDTTLIIDAADFGGKPGEFNILEAEDLKTVNLFSTHNASICLTADYLQNNLRMDIIILVIQPRNIAFGDNLSQEITETLNKLEHWFYETAKEAG